MEIKPSAARKSNGWAPVLEYDNGGRVMGQQRLGTLDAALEESRAMIACIQDFPIAFQNNHPEPNQLIDLS